MSAWPTDAPMAPDSPRPPVRSEGYRQWLARQRRTKWVVFTIQTLLLIAVILGWQALAQFRVVNPLLISSPAAVAATIPKLLASGGLAGDFLLTLKETALSVVVSLGVGVVAAVALWWNFLVARVFDPFLVVLNALPKIALGPIFFIWLGDRLSIYGMAISISVIVTILMLATGFREVSESHITLMRSLGASRWQTLTMVVLPANVPNLVATAKVNLSLNLVGVIVGEFLTSKAGLGYLILYGSQVFQMSQVMVGVVSLGIMAAVLYLLVNGLGLWLMKRYHFQ